MAEYKDSVKDQTQTIGTGTVTIDGVASAGFRTIAAAHTTGQTVGYRINNATNNEWEVGRGVWTTTGATLTRVTVYASSNGGALVNFSAGVKTVITTLVAADMTIPLDTGVSGTLPVANGGTGAGAFTQGSVPFAGASGVYTQDNANLFFDDSINCLGIGTNVPVTNLHIKGTTARETLKIQQPSEAQYTAGFFNDTFSSTIANFRYYGLNNGEWRMGTEGNTGIGLYVNSHYTIPEMYIAPAGNVGIGASTSPNANAILELVSTTQGFLGPRMTTTQRDAIASPPEGLEIYNLTTHAKNFFNGTVWV